MNTNTHGADEMVRVAVTLQRPSSSELRDLSRAEKYRVLRENSDRIRTRLIDWLNERGMAGEVSKIGEPTMFNTLFIVATQRVAEQLRRAPGVVDVGPEALVAVDIPRPVRARQR
jgi:hypothetical protein